jgi:hypothetical protein
VRTSKIKPKWLVGNLAPVLRSRAAALVVVGAVAASFADIVTLIADLLELGGRGPVGVTIRLAALAGS